MIVLKCIGILLLALFATLGVLASFAVIGGAVCSKDEEDEDHE